MTPDIPDSASSIDAQHRNLMVIWAAMLAGIALYLALAYVLRGEPAEGATANDGVALALLGAGAASVLASFVVKQRMLTRAVGEQKPGLVTTGYVVGFALSEAAGILGLVSALVPGGGFPYLLFIAAAVGMLMHFPRRDDIEAARHDEARGTGITGV